MQRGSSGGRADTSRRLMENQNDAKAEALADQVARLKELSYDIEAEVGNQNRLLEQMNGEMGSASGMLSDTITKLNLMLQTGGSRHMVYLIVFVVFAFIIIYWIMRNKG
eukprot:CAMPEP_0171625924 /NCGR_PEP_ID=MMETSP0990-20121206/19702_1 /TAXON_ID=483369 /ORGANISM="non described non described, Strain CCMP2098" /LENGTH=108 /DNA_ID=CAMNT_0012193153 /DNA_START=261 /DNA_END=587 /DNA_ORIENTATION=-